MTFEEFYLEIENKENVLFQFIDKYRDKRNHVFLFGAGFCGRVYMRLMEKYQMPIAGIVDNYKNAMDEKRVLRLDDVVANYNMDDCIFIISAPSKYQEIEKQKSLLAHGG